MNGYIEQWGNYSQSSTGSAINKTFDLSVKFSDTKYVCIFTPMHSGGAEGYAVWYCEKTVSQVSIHVVPFNNGQRIGTFYWKCEGY